MTYNSPLYPAKTTLSSAPKRSLVSDYDPKVVALSPKWVFAILRNWWSRWTEMTGRDAPKYAIDIFKTVAKM